MRVAAKVSMALGVLLVLGAISLLLYNQWDTNRATQAATQVADALTVQISSAKVKTDAAAEPGANAEPGAEAGIGEETAQLDGEMPVIAVNGDEYVGVLEIPALGLSLPVMEGWSYQKLKTAPCRFSGSIYTDDIVIMAHNYSGHFGGISSLVPGDTVKFLDAEGTELSYTVVLLETVGANDVEEMIYSEYDLTLFTCTYSGEARIALRCKAVA